jgi:hypothetical protein
MALGCYPRPVSRAWFAISVTASSILGCHGLLSLEEFEQGTTDAGGAGGSGGTPLVTCATNRVCVPLAPVGWSGPFAMTDGTGTPACSGEWDTSGVSGAELIDAPDAECMCSCAAPVGEQCGSAMYAWSSMADCPGPPMASLADGCYTAFSPPPISIQSIVFAPQAPAPGSCTATESETLPAVDSNDRQICTGAQDVEGCPGGEACMPIPGDGLERRYCISADGEPACPDSVFPERYVLFGGLDDTRACGDCSCGASADGSCDAVGEIFALNNCTSDPKATALSDGNCVNFPNPGVGALQITTTLVPGACPPILDGPGGAVTGSDPVTVCCTLEVPAG